MADERTVARFLDKCQRSGDCLLWTASKAKHGHGRFNDAGSSNLAHRFSYRTFVGPIPKLPAIENRKFLAMSLSYLNNQSERLWGKPWTS